MSLVIESCNLEEVCASFGESVRLLFQLRDRLRDWLKSQPHLPQDTTDQILEWTILSTKLSLEKAKLRLDMYYTIRNLVPELYADRDPCGPGITSLLSALQYVWLPKLTPTEKYRTSIGRVTQFDSSKLCPWQIHKFMIMMSEILMLEDCHSFGYNVIYDLSMVNLSLLVKMTPTIIKKCETAVSKAHGVRIKGIHYINAPPFVNRIVAMVKSVVKPKLAARLHVHPVGHLESLYKFVPRSILPKDYGGDCSTMDELSALWRQKLEHRRDWFVENQKILVNERLRPGPAFDADNLFGFSGSFRKLEVD